MMSQKRNCVEAQFLECAGSSGHPGEDKTPGTVYEVSGHRSAGGRFDDAGTRWGDDTLREFACPCDAAGSEKEGASSSMGGDGRSVSMWKFTGGSVEQRYSQLPRSGGLRRPRATG